MSALSRYYKSHNYDSRRGNFPNIVVYWIKTTTTDYSWHVTEPTCQLKLVTLREMDISAKTKAYILHFARRKNPRHHSHGVENPFQNIPVSTIERLNENGLWKDMVRTHLLVIWAFSRYSNNVSYRAFLIAIITPDCHNTVNVQRVTYHSITGRYERKGVHFQWLKSPNLNEKFTLG